LAIKNFFTFNKSIFLCSIVFFSLFGVIFLFPSNFFEPEPYFGVSFCGDTPEEAKLLIEKIKDYTNLFVLQSGPISKNETATNTVCNYAFDAGLDFIVFFGWFDPAAPWQISWLDYASNTWGDNFLGVYFFDEPGGIQIDQDWDLVFHHIKEVGPEFYNDIKEYVEDENQTAFRDYELVKNNYINYIQEHLELKKLNDKSVNSFTSDYALYWFDYLAGYDTVFVELGWNHDSEKHIGLCRGAANIQQKDWGTIIVWKDRNSDYDTNLVEHNETLNTGVYKTGAEMLDDMHISYEAGADYILIFNYPTGSRANPPGNPYGILTDEHFEVMQQFWDYMKQNPEKYGKKTAKVALVLPENYAWGMRHIDDRIWGYWGADELSQQIWQLSQNLLDDYGLALDIIYDDSNYQLADFYQEIYYWNDT
jgi:hypothetical protein